MPSVPKIREKAKELDTWLWRRLVGSADYMQLKPPFRLRLRIASRLPFAWAMQPCARPIFIVGCPRSGTTILFRILALSDELTSFSAESHWVWEMFHRPNRRKDGSQVLEGGDLRPHSRAFIRYCYRSAFGRRRFVDKCPANSFRIPAIRTLFPDAKFVCIFRNAFDNVSSLIDSWRHPVKFPGTPVSCPLNINGYDRQTWVHIFQPGWRDYTDRPLEEVCAHQWLASNDYLLKSKAEVPPEDWFEVRHEDLIRNPVSTIHSIFDGLGLKFSDDIERFLHSLPQHSTNTLAEPEIGGWRHRNPVKVQRIVLLVEETMERLGYDIAKLLAQPQTQKSRSCATELP